MSISMATRLRLSLCPLLPNWELWTGTVLRLHRQRKPAQPQKFTHNHPNLIPNPNPQQSLAPVPSPRSQADNHLAPKSSPPNSWLMVSLNLIKQADTPAEMGRTGRTGEMGKTVKRRAITHYIQPCQIIMEVRLSPRQV